jgi:alpha/beta superfamily hydrolase
MPEEREIVVTSGGLKLEGRLHEGAGPYSWVVLHPHPQYGGDMDNHVVVAICEALKDRGATTLRLNFRGTGASEGTYDGGRGELDDALAAVAFLRESTRGPIGCAGYSFGASIAASAAVEAGAAALVVVSPPTLQGPPPLPPRVPTLVLTGDRDPFSSGSVIAALARDGVRVAVVSGVDHGWWPGVEALKEHLIAFEPA